MIILNSKWKSLFQIFLPLILGSIIGIFISSSMDYKNLVQPPLSPPSILFPIVWTILYLLIGISYYLINKKEELNKSQKILYYTQLFVNLMWPVFFFVWKMRFFSIFWIILLDILVYLLYQVYKNKDKKIALLLIPYLLWIFFATYLNIGIYLLNK